MRRPKSETNEQTHSTNTFYNNTRWSLLLCDSLLLFYNDDVRHQIVSDIIDAAAVRPTSWLIHRLRRHDSSVTILSVADIGAADSEQSSNSRYRCPTSKSRARFIFQQDNCNYFHSVWITIVLWCFKYRYPNAMKTLHSVAYTDNLWNHTIFKNPQCTAISTLNQQIRLQCSYFHKTTTTCAYGRETLTRLHTANSLWKNSD